MIHEVFSVNDRVVGPLVELETENIALKYALILPRGKCMTNHL